MLSVIHVHLFMNVQHIKVYFCMVLQIKKNIQNIINAPNEHGIIPKKTR